MSATQSTTEAWKARQPERDAALVRHSQEVRDRNAALTPDDLFEALTRAKTPHGRNGPRDHVGARWAQQALREHLRWEPRIADVVRVIEEAFPAQVEARREAEAVEAREAEKRRREAAKEAKAAREAAAERDRLRAAVEAARQRRQASFEAEVEAEAKAALAEAK
jgi:hypothetical protein